jgi:hypothetical protein
MYGRTGEKNPLFGIARSEGTRQKIGESQQGEKNHRSKKVYQYNLDGNFINEFEYIREADNCYSKPS